MQKRFKCKYTYDKNYRKVKGHLHFTGKHRGTADSIYDTRYSKLEEISLIFHSRPNYDDPFIVKELAKKFKWEFDFVQEKIEKKFTKTMSYKLQFINNARFMASLFWSLVDNPVEEIHKVKCKCKRDNEKWWTCRTNYKYYEWSLEYKYWCCNKKYWKMFGERLKNRFSNTNRFSNHNINKFILWLGKYFWPYEYKDDWKKN